MLDFCCSGVFSVEAAGLEQPSVPLSIDPNLVVCNICYYTDHHLHSYNLASFSRRRHRNNKKVDNQDDHGGRLK